MSLMSMMRGMKSSKRTPPPEPRLLLALLFLLGAAAGYGFARSRPEQVFAALSEYLEGYCLLCASPAEGTVSLGTALRLYLLPVLTVALLGLSALGSLGIPLVFFSSGFSAMFAVVCFLRLYGRVGILPAVAAMGVRLLFVLPCLMWLGGFSWPAALSRVFAKRGKRSAPDQRDPVGAVRLLLCVVVLLIGIMTEQSVTKEMFVWAMDAL